MEHPLPAVEPTEEPQASAATSGAALSLYGASVQYGIHSMLMLVGPLEHRASSRDLADLQDLPPTVIAKVFPRLEKAGLVSATGGINGGYRLARLPEDISVLDMVDAIEGGRRLFDCKEVRARCVLFGGAAPSWATAGVCGVHAVMLRAEKSMRAEMARTSLLDLMQTVDRKAPAEFGDTVGQWLGERAATRERTRITAVRNSRRRRGAN
jgi:Rrf2 family protein